MTRVISQSELESLLVAKMKNPSEFDRSRVIAMGREMLANYNSAISGMYGGLPSPLVTSKHSLTHDSPTLQQAQGNKMTRKFNPGDRVSTREEGAGTIIRFGMNDRASAERRDSGYLVEMDSGEHNGGSPIGMNFDTADLTLIAPAPAKKKGVSFESVILAKEKKDQIVAAISQVDHHSLIFEQWGFAEVFEKGTAISLLFWGPPGTGKTLMAQAIADKYKYGIKVISTAEIETPEPGGAERNLKKYFHEANDGKTVLLFDECDSLISNRTHVGMILAAQINALLTELENYKGIVVFTTNRLDALDPAFDRRLSLKLEFPMPDAEHREKIWKRMFPKKAPLAKDIRWADLASIEIAGGHIKNVVLSAARMAAVQKLTEINDAVLWECLEREVESRDSMQDAIASRSGAYGTPLPNMGRGLARVPGKTRL